MADTLRSVLNVGYDAVAYAAPTINSVAGTAPNWHVVISPEK